MYILPSLCMSMVFPHVPANEWQKQGIEDLERAGCGMSPPFTVHLTPLCPSAVILEEVWQTLETFGDISLVGGLALKAPGRSSLP